MKKKYRLTTKGLLGALDKLFEARRLERSEAQYLLLELQETSTLGLVCPVCGAATTNEGKQCPECRGFLADLAVALDEQTLTMMIPEAALQAWDAAGVLAELDDEAETVVAEVDNGAVETAAAELDPITQHMIVAQPITEPAATIAAESDTSGSSPAPAESARTWSATVTDSAEVALFRGNLQRTGLLEVKGVRAFSKLKWKFKTGGWVSSSPVVAYDTAVHREYLADLGVYAPVGDVSAFAQAIDDLLQNPGRMADLGQKLRRRAEEVYSWETAVQQIITLYQNLTK
jgi:hypothetical protein